MAGSVDLGKKAHARGAASVSKTIKIACRVADHAREGGTPISAGRKAVKHRLVAGRIQLVHHARVRRAAAGSSPVEVACRVADHTPLGNAPISTAREGVKHR